MAYRCNTYQSKECNGCGECQKSKSTKSKYGVTIVLEQIEVEAENEDEAVKKAVDIYYSDSVTRVDNGMTVVDVEVEKLKE